MDRRTFLGGMTTACAVLSHGLAQAQDYPARPVTILVPFAAGGGQDIFMRLISQGVSDALKQPLVIDNRVGGAGNIAAGAVARAAPDGYTLLLGTAATHGMNQALYKTLNFDAQTSFEPVAMLAEVPLVLVVNRDVPAKAVAELVAYLKANPGKINYGSSGVGGPLHLAGELFKTAAGVEAVHVPFRGSAPAITELLAGRLTFMFDTFAATEPYIPDGSLRRLAVASGTRASNAPDLPTMAEAGTPVEAYSWSGVFAPAATPKPIVEQLRKAFSDAVANPALRSRLFEIGFLPTPGNPDSLRARVGTELVKWKHAAETAGLKPQ
ncbi:tripartite tricarboxylate transporter substrate-binding protein [Bosea sp. 124]|uniref:Bug family tripartite tricarboxylate transporter substrate binding protein n=1 Tax=Bosea sp. 124 TaxID=2135642 RepID=UPI000D421F0B|nr:tripartite tricarboxylate transporter substrate-binding protein [Bosea sp. 124]PTM39852.1 tripartite-type tricarboxylate transporter receptor subunit TctC [Bosea sp. 124]